MESISNIAGWVFLFVGISLYRHKKGVAKESDTTESKVELTAYAMMVLSVVAFIGGAYYG